MPSKTSSDKPRSKFVLRLIVVKLEGVLFSAPDQWPAPFRENVKFTENIEAIENTVFSEWPSILRTDEKTLRRVLEKHARTAELSMDTRLRGLLDYAQNHSPVRVAILSTGPAEWIDRLRERFSLRDISELIYGADQYPPGNRQMLLQFLMNRFIAGRERTMLIGNHSEDEHLAHRENTRFRSLEPPPEDALNPDCWNYTDDQLMEFIREKQPED